MNDFLQLLTQLPFLILISLLICIPLLSVVWAARDAGAPPARVAGRAVRPAARLA